MFAITFTHRSIVYSRFEIVLSSLFHFRRFLHQQIMSFLYIMWIDMTQVSRLNWMDLPLEWLFPWHETSMIPQKGLWTCTETLGFLFGMGLCTNEHQEWESQISFPIVQVSVCSKYFSNLEEHCPATWGLWWRLLLPTLRLFSSWFLSAVTVKWLPNEHMAVPIASVSRSRPITSALFAARSCHVQVLNESNWCCVSVRAQGTIIPRLLGRWFTCHFKI